MDLELFADLKGDVVNTTCQLLITRKFALRAGLEQEILRINAALDENIETIARINDQLVNCRAQLSGRHLCLFDQLVV